MMEGSVGEMVSSNKRAEREFFKWRPWMVILMKWAFKIAMWAVFICWLAVYFLYPVDSFDGFFTRVLVVTQSTFFGLAGGVLLVFSGQIFVLAILAAVYLAFFPRQNPKKKKRSLLRFRLWTFPVLTDGPFGIVSAAELIGIIVFFAYIIWSFYLSIEQNYRTIFKMPLPSKEKSYKMLKKVGLRMGSIGLVCMGVLFLPIARGSILLRLINVPVEQATRYHIWVGHTMMVIITFHSLAFVVLWSLQGRLLPEIVQWKCLDIANLPGLFAFVAGLLMWMTSFHRVRKQRFELFYYTHHLYAAFIIFVVLHTLDSVFSIASGGVFIFVADRFLRFCQSRRTIEVISATCLPCGTIELVLPKPKNLRYNALSFIFLRVPELSWLQWHPLSVSSSPLDGRFHLSVLIKVLGDWTRKLKDYTKDTPEQPQDGLAHQSHPKITASVEGPYGHELAHHLTYENMVLVAGGIGISPFLAILRDILHRIQMNEPCLPKNVILVWAVKGSKELCLLSMANAESLCPSFPDKLQLAIQIYVTQESEPPLEDGKPCKNVGCSAFPTASGSSSMSGLVGTGNNIWAGIYIVSSIIGFVILLGLMEAFYVTPFDVKCWWYKGLLFLGCMIAGIVIFGGPVIFLWHRWEKNVSSHENHMNGNNENSSTRCNDGKMQGDVHQSHFGSMSTIKYGCRPNFREIFDSIAKQWGKVDVGVFVCGPRSLQSSVAAECRSQTIWGSKNQSIFHFNNHSFEF